MRKMRGSVHETREPTGKRRIETQHCGDCKGVLLMWCYVAGIACKQVSRSAGHIPARISRRAGKYSVGELVALLLISEGDCHTPAIWNNLKVSALSGASQGR